jgi:ADP-heptose:LPS heptosyltransferase
LVALLQPGNRARLSLLRLAGGLLGRTRHPPDVPRRVLLIRPDHVGDVVLTSPAVALLRASLPETQLTYLVGPWSLEAARHGPSVQAVRVLAFPGFTRRPNPNLLAPYALLLREAARLRKARFDAAVVFRPDHWWGALLALVAGIPVRIGSDVPETRPLLTHALQSPPGTHATERALATARLALGAFNVDAAGVAFSPVFTLSDASTEHCSGLEPQRTIAIHPSAGAPLKSWPISSWAHVVDALAGRGLQVVLTGAPDDRPLLAAITAKASGSATILAGQSLAATAAVYARCALLVSVDSGAAHLAAAVGTPTVRLYGPAPPDVFGPWPTRPDQQVLLTDALACAPCGALDSPPCGATALPACMLALSVDDVLKAIEAQLGRG